MWSSTCSSPKMHLELKAHVSKSIASSSREPGRRMRGHVTLCHMAVSGNLNSPLNLFISFVKALMEQGFRSDLFLAKDTCACRIHQTLSRDHRIPVPVRRAAPVPAGAGGQGQPRGLSQLQRGAF